MGNVNLIPIFGDSFTSFFPLLLAVLCICTYMDLYGKFMSFFGVKNFVFSSTFNDRLIFEGRDFLQIKRKKSENKQKLN